MKKRIIIIGIVLAVVFIIGGLSDLIARNFNIKPEYLGTWTSPTEKITVRTEPQFMHFIFTEGKADFSITINEDKTASGHIGQAKFEHAKINFNGGLWPVKWSGIIYTIQCGEVGKIFDDDPLDRKKLEVWVLPLKEDGTMEVEIRFGTFPMAGFICKKAK